MECRRLHGRGGLLHSLVQRAADQGIAWGMSLLQYRWSLNLVAERFCAEKRQHSQIPVSWLTNASCERKAVVGLGTAYGSSRMGYTMMWVDAAEVPRCLTVGSCGKPPCPLRGAGAWQA